MSRLIRNTASLGIVQLVNYIFPLITVPYISRIIGPEGYGVVNYATSFIAYFTILIAYGFDLTATRRIAQNKDDIDIRNKVFTEVINARIFLFSLSAIFFIISLLLFEPLRDNLYVTVILFFSCVSVVLTPQFIYQGLQELSIYAKVNFCKGVLTTILLFVFIQEPDDYYWLPTINIVVGIMLSLFLLANACYKFNLKFTWVPIGSTLKLLNDEKGVFFSTILISLYTTTNVVVLGFFDSAENVGIFTISQTFINIVNSVTIVPISTALYPFIGESFTKSRETGLLMVKKIIPIIIMMVFFGCIFLYFLSPFLVPLLYGNKFSDSILPVKIMSFLPLFIALSNIFGVQVLMNLKMDQLFLKIIGICSLFGFLGAFFMSKFWGYIGVAWNIMLVEAIVTLVMYFILRKQGINLIELKFFKLKAILSFVKYKLFTKV